MTKREPLLSIRLEGGSAREGRITVDALTEVLKKVQLCVKRLGQVLTGETGTAKPGRIRAEVESACVLDVVADEMGGFTVAVDAPLGESHQQALFNLPEPLGEMAVEKMLDGLDLLAGRTPRLANEFDYGVLVALRDASHLLDHGVLQMKLSRRSNGKPARTVSLDQRVREQLLHNITGPIKSAVEVRGVLREVDLEKRSCQIYPQSGPHVDCSFEDKHEPIIKDLLDHYVVATGEATLREADGRNKKMIIQDIEGAEEEALALAERAKGKPRTGRELVAALRATGMIGLWRNRKDIGDSSEFARSLRERAQRRERGEE